MLRAVLSFFLLCLISPKPVIAGQSEQSYSGVRFEADPKAGLIPEKKEFDKSLRDVLDTNAEQCQRWLQDIPLYGKCIFLPPFTAPSLLQTPPAPDTLNALLVNPYRSQGRRNYFVEFIHSWVPASLVEGAEALIQTLESHVDTSEPLRCVGSVCYFARRLLSPPNTSATMVGICSSYKLPEGFSAPDCGALYAIDRGEKWLVVLVGVLGRVIPKWYGGRPSWSLPEEILQFGSRCPIGISGDVAITSQLKRAVVEVLTKPDLSLTLIPTPVPDRVVAGASSRLSPILKPLRETVSVEVYFYLENEEKSLTQICPEITLYVNRYNTDAPEDWHKPNDRQLDDYRSYLLKSLRDRIVALCPGGDPDPSSTTIKCSSETKPKTHR